MSKQSGRFVWFESSTRDPKRAQGFYGELFGWRTEAFSMGPETYEMVKAGDKTIGGYVKDDAGPAHWVSYLSSLDVDGDVARAKAAGAKVTVEPFNVPTVGRMAGLVDPQGAAFMIYKSDGDGGADDEAATGEFTWNELMVPDPAAAVAFYEKVWGFTHQAMDMGPAGTYRLLEKDGKPRGGVMAAEKGMPSAWMPYVAVVDADATAAKGKKLGGKVLVEPTDIPNVGRFAVLQDNQGAPLGVLARTPAR